MNVGLIDVDSHNFPNLVLMKLSAWHKAQGNTVDLLKPENVLNGSNLFQSYDKLYGACVFSGHDKTVEALRLINACIGGTGTNTDVVLPAPMEHIMPDYSLYGITDVAYGFLTRGCPRQCPFCIVSEKEGAQSRKVADLSEWWAGQKIIKLLDPNLLACPEHEDLLKQLADSHALVDFTQGIDARLLTDDNIALLSKIKIKIIHFAWDSPRDATVPKALLRYRNAKGKIDPRRNVVYVLTNYWSTHEEDLYRVYWLRDNGYDPYVMIYDKSNAPTVTRHLQRWVNNRRIFRSIKKFEEYNPRMG